MAIIFSVVNPNFSSTTSGRRCAEPVNPYYLSICSSILMPPVCSACFYSHPLLDLRRKHCVPVFFWLIFKYLPRGILTTRTSTYSALSFSYAARGDMNLRTCCCAKIISGMHEEQSAITYAPIASSKLICIFACQSQALSALSL